MDIVNFIAEYEAYFLLGVNVVILVMLLLIIVTDSRYKDEIEVCKHDSFYSGKWDGKSPFTCAKCNKTF